MTFANQSRRGRILRLPPRKGIWLFDYKDIKYESRLQWFLHLILGLVALGFGFAMCALIIFQAKRGSLEFIPILFAICSLLWGLLYAPAAVIYFIRRHRGEPTDVFDYEIVNSQKQQSSMDKDPHAANHR